MKLYEINGKYYQLKCDEKVGLSEYDIDEKNHMVIYHLASYDKKRFTKMVKDIAEEYSKNVKVKDLLEEMLKGKSLTEVERFYRAMFEKTKPKPKVGRGCYFLQAKNGAQLHLVGDDDGPTVFSSIFRDDE